MLKHVLDMHENENEKIEFVIRMIKFTRSSFERQILESCLIQEQRKKHHILNSKAEYNRCAVPRLMTKIGDKEFEKYGKEILEEKKKEEIIEGKITRLRKARNALRKETPKNIANKRRKLDRDTYIENLERWGRPEMTISKKRTDENEEDGEPPKKRYRQTKIDDNWKTKEIDTLVGAGEFGGGWRPYRGQRPPLQYEFTGSKLWTMARGRNLGV